MTDRLTRIAILLLAAALTTSARPAGPRFRLPTLLSDHMVLQQGKPVRIWGWADRGDEITVAFAGQTKTVKAGTGPDGKWVVSLDPLTASSKGRTLTVRSAATRRKFEVRDVVVGEVWVFARQTTIDVSLAKTKGAAEAANAKGIRHFRVEAAARPARQDDFTDGDLSGGRFFHYPIEAPKPTGKPAGPWQVSSPATAGSVSGAALYFARGVRAKLGVPVGIVDIDMGPSVLGSWMSREVLETAGTSDVSFSNVIPKAGELGEWNEDKARADYREALAKWEKNLANRRKNGESTNLIKPTEPIYPGYLLLMPGGCYNACVWPMRHLSMRGVLLYQGANHPYFLYPRLGRNFDPAEACNAYYSSYTYKKFLRYAVTHKNFRAFLPDWRKTFGDESLPFGVIQPCGSGNERHGRDVLSSQLARYREVQAQVCAEQPNTGLIVAFDQGEAGSRQPRDEAELGRRCLLWALAEVYGKRNVPYAGPVYQSMAKKGSRIVLTFGDGRLRARDGELSGFVVGDKYEDHAGKTRSRFVPANARITGQKTIEVWSNAIAEPVAVRYAWATVPVGNLVNEAGLPAGPFRTDDWAAEDDGFRALPDDLKEPMSEWAEPSLLLYGEKVALDTLGPTGLRGYVLGRNIIVGAIEPGSPADGAIHVNDTLIGANGRMFGVDPRVVLGSSIDESEAEKGVLRLKLVRSGEVREVALKLEVTGAYADTSPYGCPKARKIVTDARKYVIEQMGADGNSGLCGAASGLLLLSSGDPAHLDPVRRLAYGIVPSAMKLKPEGPNNPWNWHPAYEAVFLAEYYMATGDRTVLPALERYRDFFAYTQDPRTGVWGHGGAPGKHNYSYAGAALGRVNAVGTICFMAWVMIQECGLPLDKAAFAKADTFFREHTVDGIVGYGAEPIKPLREHVAPEDFGKGLLPGCNGKSAATAVNYFVLEPGGKLARECAALVADSYTRREKGHGGEFFSYVWGPIAASLGERKGFLRFMEKQRWYYALCRRFDHGWSCQSGGGDSRKYLKYGPEFPTGGYALAYAIPEKRLRVFGAPRSIFGQPVPEALAAAKALYDKRQYARCIQALRRQETPTAKQLREAAERMDASIDLTLRATIRDINEGDLYMARARLTALKPILPDGEDRCAPVETVLDNPENEALLAAGKRFYANHGKRLTNDVRYVEGVAVDDRARRAMDALAKDPDAGIYATWATRLLAENPSEARTDEQWTPLLEPNVHPWRLIVAERETLLPGDWRRPDCDDSAWYETTLPNAWWLDHWAVLRARFRLADPKQFKKLRLAMRFEFCLDTEVYLNGRKIVRCERGVCAEPSVDLGEREMQYLRAGENVLTIKSLNWFRWNGITMHPFKVRLEGQK